MNDRRSRERWATAIAWGSVVVLAAVAASMCFGPAASGQEPDYRGERRAEQPSFRGRTANAPIPTRMHIHNEGGSDGAGLCVISSILANGWFQRVPGLNMGKGSALWRAAKSRPGGYHPAKLKSLVEEVMPGEGYASYLGTDPTILDRLSAKGFPIGITMNTAALYNYRPIHHMVSLIHYSIRSGWAMYVDNNDPGMYHILPVSELNRRWPDGGVGWAWIWTRPVAGPGRANGSFAAAVLIVAAALVASEDRSND